MKNKIFNHEDMLLIVTIVNKLIEMLTFKKPLKKNKKGELL